MLIRLTFSSKNMNLCNTYINYCRGKTLLNITELSNKLHDSN